MQPGVLQCDRQPEPGATGGPGARGIRPPEPAEDHLRLFRAEAHAVVADGHRGGVLVVRGADPDRLTLAVLDRVPDQVAQDPLDPARVHLRAARLRHVQLDLAALAQQQGLVVLQHPGDDVAQVDVLQVERGGAGVEPADLQQVGEQFLEPVELVLQQLDRAPGDRVEVVARLMQQVGRHPDRGERRSQLVRDVGDEPALQPGQLLQPADLLLQVARHLVEGDREPGQVVGTADLHPLLQPAGREPLGDPAGHSHRRDHLTGDQPGDRPEQYHEQQAGRHQSTLDHVQGLPLGGQREQEVDLVALTGGVHPDLRADRQHPAHSCRRCSLILV